MAQTSQIRKVATGYNYRVYKGCNVNNGKAVTATADRIVGGWAATKRTARNEAQAYMGE